MSKKTIIILMILAFNLFSGSTTLVNAQQNVSRESQSIKKKASSIINVNSISELVTEFNAAQDGDTLLLTSAFKTDVSTSSIGVVLSVINTNDKNITIDGDNIILTSTMTADLFTLTHNGTGKITFKNIKSDMLKGNFLTIKGNGLVDIDNIDAVATTKSAIRNENTGTLSIKNSSFTDGKAPAYNEATTSAHNATIDNSYFAKNNLSLGAGAAISISSNATTSITNSSFLENKTGATGYSGGAVSTQSDATNVTLNIDHCYFNENSMTNNPGGAIGIYHLKGGNITINASMFENNHAYGNNNTSDGGAIAIKNNTVAYTGTMVISNNVFLKNTAYDNAGAILIEATNEGVTSAKVFNNTFVQNQADATPSAGVGGAIQTYGSPTSVITHNTFYQNKVLQSGGGGAIGISGPTLSSNSAQVANNIFVDNYAPNATVYKQNVSTKATVTANVANNGNVGYDNGSKFITDNDTRNALVKLENIFTSFYKPGDTIPSYAVEGDAKSINVGDAGSTKLKQTMFSYIPSPRIDEMLRTNNPRIFTGVLEDVRGYPRERLTVDNPYYPNAGAVEIFWTKFDPGLSVSGNWSNRFNVENEGGIESLAFPGIFYKINNPPIILPDGTPVFEDNFTFTRNTLLGPVDYGFVGWKNLQLPTQIFSVNQQYKTRKQTFVAQWQKNIFHLDFDLKGGTTKTGHDADFATQDINNGVNNNLGTIPNSIPEKPGYTFDGWYDDDTYTGLIWDFATAQIFADTTLYAKWSESKYTVSFDMRGHGQQVPSQVVSQGEVVQKPTNPIADGYIFEGWYTNASFTGSKWNFEVDKVNSNLTLYAKWSSLPGTKVVITFVMNDPNNKLQDVKINIPKGSSLKKSGEALLKPTTADYDFIGWCTLNKACSKSSASKLTKLSDGSTSRVFNENTIVTKNVSVYAQWKSTKKLPISGSDNLLIVTLGAIITFSFIGLRRKIKR